MKMSEKRLRATGVSILMTMFLFSQFRFYWLAILLYINQIFFNQKTNKPRFNIYNRND